MCLITATNFPEFNADGVFGMDRGSEGAVGGLARGGRGRGLIGKK